MMRGTGYSAHQAKTRVLNPEAGNRSNARETHPRLGAAPVQMTIPLRKWLTPLAILAIAGFAALALIRSKPAANPVVVREKAWLVSAETVEPRTWAPVLTLYGRVESLWSTDLTAAVAAEVIEVAVIEGDEVERGQLLLQLDERDARLVLQQREAELAEVAARIASERTRHAADLESLPRQRSLLDLAQAEVRRLQNLVTKQVGAQSQLDTARQALQTQAIALDAREQSVADHPARLAELTARKTRLEALRDQAQLDLERCRVVAPFNGRVSRVLVAPGRRVRIGDPLIGLFDTDALVVRAQVPTRHLPAVRRAREAGTELRVVGEIDGEPIGARLLNLAGEVGGATGGVEALFRIDRGTASLQQGRFVRLDLRLPEQEGLIALPYEAIYGGDRVYVIDADSRMRPVGVQRVGETRTEAGQTRVLVRAPVLAPGERIITTQIPNAVDGLLIRLPQAEKPA
jgi:multidrug efflux pump subunit AcrA (membrane-fusion protein)